MEPPLWAGILAGASFLPWVIVLRNQMQTLQGSYWMQFTGVGCCHAALRKSLHATRQCRDPDPAHAGMFRMAGHCLLYAILHRSENLGSFLWLAFLPLPGRPGFVDLQPILHYRPTDRDSPFFIYLLAMPSKPFSKGMRSDGVPVPLCGDFHCATDHDLGCEHIFYARVNKTSGASIALTYIQEHWQPGDVI